MNICQSQLKFRRVAAAWLLGSALALRAQPAGTPLDVPSFLSPPQNEMRVVADRYQADHGNLTRFYNVAISPTRIARLEMFDHDWLAALQKLDTNRVSAAARTEYGNLVTKIQDELTRLHKQSRAQEQVAPFVPFAQTILDLDASRRGMETMDAEKSAGIVDGLARRVAETHAAVEAASKGATTGGGAGKFDLAEAGPAGEMIGTLRTVLKSYNGFYNQYDPLFTWWMAAPYPEADQALADYASFLRDIPSSSSPPGASEEAGMEVSMPAIKLPGKNPEVPDLRELMAMPQSQMRGVLEHFQGGGGGRGGGGRGGRGGGRQAGSANEAAAGRVGGVTNGASTNEVAGNLGGRGGGRGGRGGRGARITKESGQEWLAGLRKIDFDKLSHDDQVDYVLLRNRIEFQLRALDVPTLRGSVPRNGPAKADGSDIVGLPIGRDGLAVDLYGEMIPYTPEEVITIGEREFAWCESEMKKASRQMGFGDDWHKAVEKVKTMHVAPGEQPYLIRDLAWDAINYLAKHDLITVPEIARETWGMEMMTPQRQLVNPFFTGGPVISVSYPTDTMTHEQKMESMRGNNIPFAHATVFHELIPGHELQGFMSSRYHTERRLFNTPFYGEGWACYWELYMYQRGYDMTPENRIGALFWRMHRCARIIFSLNFHMGRWTPQQCINFLVESMGHERDNATAEVRRSFDGSYAPLYQAAYLLGALQLLDLHKEMVDSGKMSNRVFHDTVVQADSMPIAMIRAIVMNQKLTPDYQANWRFCGATPATWKP